MGCFLPWEENVAAGPNARRFIERPTQHPNTSHPFTVKEKVDTGKNTKKIDRRLSASTKKVLTVEKPTTSKTTSSNKQVVLTGKFAKKLKFRHVGSTLNTKINISSTCADDLDRFAKGYCFSIVHTGVNKALSNEAILENYYTAIAGE